jgi:origin recognition complex subunit 3
MEGKESWEALAYRHTMYQQTMALLRQHIHDILSSAYAEGIERIGAHVASVEPPSGTSRIPAAAVLTGLNAAETASPLAPLLSHLQAQGHTIAILPAEQVKTMAHAMQVLVGAVLPEGMQVSTSYRNNNPFTMSHVADAFQSLSPSATEDAGASRDQTTGKFVLAFPDFHNFPMDVLRRLIDSCANYLYRVPFVLVFGITSYARIIRDALTEEYACKLAVSRFHLNSSQSCAYTLLERVLLHGEGMLKLSSRTLTYLIESYDLCNLSVTGMCRNLDSALLSSFYSQPLVLLQNLVDEDEAPLVMQLLQPEHLQAVRQLPSFRAHLEQLASANQLSYAKQLLTDDSALCTALPTFMHSMVLYQHRFRVALTVLYELQGLVHTPSFRKNLKTLMKFGLEGTLLGGDHVRSLLVLMSRMTLDEAHTMLSGSVSVLEESGLFPTELEQLRAFQAEREEKFEDSDDEDRAARRAFSESGLALSHRDVARAAQVVAKSRTSRNSSTRSISEQFKAGGWSEYLHRVKQFYITLFEVHLRSYTSLPLHEVCYPDASQRLRKLFSPQPRAAIQTALAYPKHYLNCQCCPDSLEGVGVVLDSMPDASIAYNLYLECGKMINLADYFTSFCSIFGLEESEELQARFMLVLSGKLLVSVVVPHTPVFSPRQPTARYHTEMELLGFVKKTTRKRDHVQRMTWGSV